MNLTGKDVAQIFVRSLQRFFSKGKESDLEILTPYLLFEKPEFLSFSSLIGISGEHKGFCYFTAEEEMLHKLAEKAGETDVLSSEQLCDFVGEITNTLSGNARADLGPGFMISVPFSFEGEPKNIHLHTNLTTLCLPLRWQGFAGLLVVALEDIHGTDL